MVLFPELIAFAAVCRQIVSRLGSPNMSGSKTVRSTVGALLYVNFSSLAAPSIGRTTAATES
jgi:hypothetical protein